MAPFDLEDLGRRGFAGFVPVAELVGLQPAQVPVESGVYAVARTHAGPARFLERGSGGWWKGEDPNEPVDRSSGSG